MPQMALQKEPDRLLAIPDIRPPYCIPRNIHLFPDSVQLLDHQRERQVFIPMADSDDYRLVIEEHPGYLFACVEAEELSRSLIVDYQQRIARQIQKHNNR